jgi:hypothetical protein
MVENYVLGMVTAADAPKRVFLIVTTSSNRMD